MIAWLFLSSCVQLLASGQAPTSSSSFRPRGWRVRSALSQFRISSGLSETWPEPKKWNILKTWALNSNISASMTSCVCFPDNLSSWKRILGGCHCCFLALQDGEVISSRWQLRTWCPLVDALLDCQSWLCLQCWRSQNSQNGTETVSQVVKITKNTELQ